MAANLERNTIVGLCVSLLLAGCKLAGGLLGHSSALVADAVESFADTIGSLLVWHALRVADRPPDERHAYGYGRAEAVATLGVGVLLLLAAGGIVLQAAEALATPHAAPAAWTLAVLIVVIAAKEGLYRFILAGAGSADSGAAAADAWHHRSDAVTSAAALLGVGVAVWGPRCTGAPWLVLADEVAAIIAAGIITATALRLMLPAWREALDVTPPGLIDQVRRDAARVEGVMLVEKVRARQSGRWYYVDVHVHVDPELSVRAAHAISGKVRAALRAAQPRIRDALVHIEPAQGAQEAGPTRA